MLPKLLAASALLAPTACGTYSTSWDREVGSEVDKGEFGNATMNNTLIQTGEMSYTVALAERFAAEAPDTINFAFNSYALSDKPRRPRRNRRTSSAIFRKSASGVFGHTDKESAPTATTSASARVVPQAAVAYLTSLGISRSRLEAVVSMARPGRSSRPTRRRSATAAP